MGHQQRAASVVARNGPVIDERVVGGLDGIFCYEKQSGLRRARMGQRSKTSITAFTYCSVLWTRLARFQIEPLLRQMSAPRWVGCGIDLRCARQHP